MKKIKLLIPLLVAILGIGLAMGQTSVPGGLTCISCDNQEAKDLAPGTAVTIYDETDYSYYEDNYDFEPETDITRTWTFWTCPVTGSPVEYKKIGVGGSVMGDYPDDSDPFSFYAPLEDGCYMAVLTTEVKVTTAAGVRLTEPCVSYACWKICVNTECPSCNDAFCEENWEDFVTSAAKDSSDPAVTCTEFCFMDYDAPTDVPESQIDWYIFEVGDTIDETTIAAATTVDEGSYCLGNVWDPYEPGKYNVVYALWNPAHDDIISFCVVGQVDVVEDPTAGITDTEPSEP